MGVDPGEKYIGWAIFDLVERRFRSFGVSGISEFYGILLQNPAHLYVVEDYRIKLDSGGSSKSHYGSPTKSYSHRWSRVVPAKLIGAIEIKAWEYGAEVILQPLTDKVLGYGLLGQPYKKGAKDKHHLDAMAHIASYFQKRGGWANAQRV